jgi:hypothetical protein
VDRRFEGGELWGGLNRGRRAAMWVSPQQNLKNCRYLKRSIEYENGIKYRGNVCCAERYQKCTT